MVKVYSMKTVATMSSTERDAIINYGIPIETYTKGIAHIGADNRSSVERAATLATKITEFGLPLPPSRFTEFVVETTTSKVSKRDYRISLDGRPGTGKSYSAFGEGCRYGIDLAEAWGQDPKDWFSLENCALLQDGEGVTKLMDECDKYQCVLIDDAGVSASSRNWQSPENKALGAIMQTCRTKRWFLIYTAPARKMMDNQIRDLVYAKGYVYKPCHAAQFNLVKLNSTYVNPDDPSNKEYKHRFSFDDCKMSFYAIYSPDLLDPYKGLVKKYDELRDKAGDAIIHEKAQQNHERKNPVSKAEVKWNAKVEKWYSYIEGRVKQGGRINRLDIMGHTGLTDREIIKMIAMVRQKQAGVINV